MAFTCLSYAVAFPRNHLDPLDKNLVKGIAIKDEEPIIDLNQKTADVNETLPLFRAMAAAAYCTKFTVQKSHFPCGSGHSNGCPIDALGVLNATEIIYHYQDPNTTASAYIAYSYPLESIVIVFKGTDNLPLTLLDARFYFSMINVIQKTPHFDAMPNSKGNFSFTDFERRQLKVHTGFLQYWTSLRYPVMTHLYDAAMAHPNYKIVFIGHSLGGAVANLASVDWYNQFPDWQDRISVATFGQPRVGNIQWADYCGSLPFASRVYRVANKGDPVVHLPPNFLAYYHSIRQYEIDVYGPATPCYDNRGKGGEGYECLQDGKFFNIAAHSNYYNYTNTC